MKDEVSKNPEYYSIIPVPNPVIVPGGRFIEFYYWDSYWIIRGLLYSQMFDTARGMIENFFSIVNRFGFIPNGGRVYYHGRSQPPLLTGMVKSYVDFTNDDKFAIDALDTLEHEFEFFVNNHNVTVKNHSLCVYRDSSSGPRPESYREDVETGEEFPTDEAKELHYSELKAGAESGMDFSSRWFISPTGTNEGNRSALSTTSIVPVDLNAYLYWNAKLIAEFHSKAGNTKKVTEYETKAEKLLLGIQEVLWNEEAGVWLDYDMINQKPRDYYTPTNLSPLWVKAFNISESEKISASVMAYIERNKLDSFPGGVPNTLSYTGEQWDAPNVWAPMQYILVEGLNNLNTPEAKNMSLKWATRWVKTNFAAFSKDRHMYEKVSVEFTLIILIIVIMIDSIPIVQRRWVRSWRRRWGVRGTDWIRLVQRCDHRVAEQARPRHFHWIRLWLPSRWKAAVERICSQARTQSIRHHCQHHHRLEAKAYSKNCI